MAEFQKGSVMTFHTKINVWLKFTLHTFWKEWTRLDHDGKIFGRDKDFLTEVWNDTCIDPNTLFKVTAYILLKCSQVWTESGQLERICNLDKNF